MRDDCEYWRLLQCVYGWLRTTSMSTFYYAVQNSYNHFEKLQGAQVLYRSGHLYCVIRQLFNISPTTPRIYCSICAYSTFTAHFSTYRDLRRHKVVLPTSCSQRSCSKQSLSRAEIYRLSSKLEAIIYERNLCHWRNPARCSLSANWCSCYDNVHNRRLCHSFPY